MAGLCPDIGNKVETYLDKFVANADVAVSKAYNALNAHPPTIFYTSARYPGLKADLAYDGNITGTTPTTKVTGTIGVSYPPAPTLGNFNALNLPTTPTLTETSPINEMPDKPIAGAVPDKVISPDITSSLTLPPVPTITYPTLSGLNKITIPTIEPLNIPAFTKTAPTVGSLVAPTEEFSYINEDFSAEIVTQIDKRMQEMVDNQFGIPDYVWDLLWQQGRERESESTNQLLDEINIDMASRGFFLPQGIQLARIDKAKQDSLVKTNTINREQVVAAEQEKIKRFEFHVTQGIAYAQLKGQWHIESQNRILEAAKYAFDASVELFKAKVEFFNTKVLIFKTEAEIYKIQIDAEVSRLESKKVELEAQQLVSELNKDIVSIYTAELEALNVKANVYKTQVEAVVTALEQGKLELGIYTQDIANYSEQVNASTIAYNNYKTEADVKGIEFKNYESAVSAFSSEVQAYKVNVEAQTAINQNISENNKNLVLNFETNVKALDSVLKGQIAKLEAETNTLDAEIKLYTAQTNTGKMNVDAKLQSQANQISLLAQEVQLSIQNAKSSSDNSLASSKAAVERTNAIGQLYTGLASASISAASVSYGDSTSTSASCSESFAG